MANGIFFVTCLFTVMRSETSQRMCLDVQGILACLRAWKLVSMGLLWILGYIPAQVEASGAMLTAKTFQLDAASFMEVLEDPQKTLSLAQVQTEETSRQFVPWRGTGDLNLGYTASAWWIRIPIQRDSHAPPRWLIEAPYLNLDELDFYAPGQPPVHTGNSRPLETRPVPHRFFVFPYEPRESMEYVYFRVASAYSMTVPLTIWQPEAFEQSNQRNLMLQWLYFGGLLALLLYNLFIFFSLRDARFLVYAAYVGFFGLGMLAGNGLGRVELWPHATRFDAVSQSFFLCLAAMLSMVLTRLFLDTPRLSVRLNRALQLCACLFFILAIAYWASTHTHWGVQTLHGWMMIMVVPSAALIMLAGVKALRAQQLGARFFVVAWFVLWLGALVSAARAMGWLPTNSFTAYSLQLSSAIEMLLLALALADLIRLERNAKEIAQTQALQASNTMLSTMRASGERLELAVKQRTQELAHALEQERKLSEQQSRLGALISHEFRNPLGIIDSQISLMRKESDLGRLNVDTRARIMSQAVQRLRSLFDTWLTSDRVRHSLEEGELTPLHAGQWLTRISQTLQHLVIDHQFALEGAELPSWILADAYLLEIAITNLIDNACKYSAAGTSVRVVVQTQSNEVGIAVMDQGIGIENHLHSDIFHDYYRAHPERGVPGFGLGLAFVSRVVSLHQGRIEVRSEMGKGSTFCLWFPATESPEVSP